MARPRKTKTESDSTSPKTPRRRAATSQVETAGVQQSTPTAPAEEVASEAYRLFLARGGQHGDALTDWLAAERIVRERRVNGAA
jgi:DUF2934 family protein